MEGEYTQEGDVNPSVRSRVPVCVCAHAGRQCVSVRARAGVPTLIIYCLLSQWCNTARGGRDHEGTRLSRAGMAGVGALPGSAEPLPADRSERSRGAAVGIL